jgi:hypothetical protein
MMNDTASGTFCPACKMRNEAGAIICTYCNTPLPASADRQKTRILSHSQEVTGTLPENSFDDYLDTPLQNRERFLDFEIPSKGIVLINLEDGQPVAMLEKDAFILGRASSEIKTQVPLVDLTSLGLDYGISRTHALIRQTENGYQITDLDSSNGTWLENERLIPKQSYEVESGNRVRMGRLNMLVYYPKAS